MPEALTARQKEIVAAAEALLAGEGMEALTVKRLGERLGIKAPSLYKHFDGKAAIEAQVISRGFVRFAAALEPAGTDLGALGRAYRCFALGNPQLYRLMTEVPLVRERLDPGVEERAAAPIVAACGGDRVLARATWAFAHGMVELELAGRFPPDADLDAAWSRGTAALGAAN